jgi:hypothetical protein
LTKGNHQVIDIAQLEVFLSCWFPSTLKPFPPLVSSRFCRQGIKVFLRFCTASCNHLSFSVIISRWFSCPLRVLQPSKVEGKSKKMSQSFPGEQLVSVNYCFIDIIFTLTRIFWFTGIVSFCPVCDIF